MRFIFAAIFSGCLISVNIPSGWAGAAQRGASAAETYHAFCSVCHGDRGNGRSRAARSLVPPPRDFTNEQARRELTRARVIAAITHGKPGTAMVGYASRLTTDQIAALADFVTTSLMQPRAPSSKPSALKDSAAIKPTVDMSLPFPNGLKGNAQRGAAFYAGNCATCHGIKGDGAGPRAYFINPPPRNFRAPDFATRYNRPALFAAIAQGKVGTEMPAWRSVLNEQQIADVAEYLARQFSAASTASDPSAKR